MSLTVNGARYQVAQVGGGRIVLADDAVIAGDRGEFLVSIDGQEQGWAVVFGERDGKTWRVISATLHPIDSLGAERTVWH